MRRNGAASATAPAASGDSGDAGAGRAGGGVVEASSDDRSDWTTGSAASQSPQSLGGRCQELLAGDELGWYGVERSYVRAGIARRFSALPPGNTAENVTRIRVPAGTTIREGVAAPQPSGQPLEEATEWSSMAISRARLHGCYHDRRRHQSVRGYN